MGLSTAIYELIVGPIFAFKSKQKSRFFKNYITNVSSYTRKKSFSFFIQIKSFGLIILFTSLT